MLNINSIAGSALQTIGISQQVTANNVANLSTDNFKSSRVTLQENDKGGVRTTVSSTQDSVDISREAINLISNKHAFTANLSVIKVADDMTKELLGIKERGYDVS